MPMHFMGLLLPYWLLAWIALGGVIAWLLGATRITLVLFGVLVMDIFVLPILEPWLVDLPVWMIALSIVATPLLAAHAVITLTFGSEAAGQFTGSWLARITEWFVLGVGRVVRALWRKILSR